jgi:hypothetical protein
MNEHNRQTLHPALDGVPGTTLKMRIATLKVKAPACGMWHATGWRACQDGASVLLWTIQSNTLPET